MDRNITFIRDYCAKHPPSAVFFGLRGQGLRIPVHLRADRIATRCYAIVVATNLGAFSTPGAITCCSYAHGSGELFPLTEFSPIGVDTSVDNFLSLCPGLDFHR
jgi:hypothetical protein